MEEILKEIEKEMDAIRKEQKDLEELEKHCKKLLQEEKELESQRDEIRDSSSGFYQDISQKLEEKHNEFILATNKRINKGKKIEQLIVKKKEEIIKHIEDKKHYIDENRNGKDAKEKFIELDDWKRQIEANFNRKGFEVILEEIDKKHQRKEERQGLNKIKDVFRTKFFNRLFRREANADGIGKIEGKKVTKRELQRAFKEGLHSNVQLDDEDRSEFLESQIEEHENSL